MISDETGEGPLIHSPPARSLYDSMNSVDQSLVALK